MKKITVTTKTTRVVGSNKSRDFGVYKTLSFIVALIGVCVGILQYTGSRNLHDLYSDRPGNKICENMDREALDEILRAIARNANRS